MISRQPLENAAKGTISDAYSFSSSRVWMWESDYKESWAQNWYFWTVVLETLESPLDCKEIQPVHPKVDQSWVFTGRTDVEAETPILWPPEAKSWLIWKDPDAGKDCGQEEKGTTEDEMVGWHHQLNGMSLGELRELVMDRAAWHAVVHVVAKSRTWLSDWTELNFVSLVYRNYNSVPTLNIFIKAKSKWLIKKIKWYPKIVNQCHVIHA